MKLLVTGGCGFIGSNFINYILKNNDCTVVNIDCLNYCGKESNISTEFENDKNRYTFIYGNITDRNLIKWILEKYNINIVVHFAAQSHVDNSFDNSTQYTIDNVLGTHTLLQACKEYNRLDKFIHFSTDEVYGEVDLEHTGCCEKSLLNPTNPYAATKAAAEFLVRSYYHSFKMPVIIMRCNNVYGFNQYPEKLIPKFIKQLKNGERLTVHGTGQTRRNFIWADDVSSAVAIVMGKGIINEIYNIGTTQEYSVMDIAGLLVQELCNDKNMEANIVYVPDRPFNDFRYAVNCDKLKSLGWSEQHNDFKRNIRSLLKE